MWRKPNLCLLSVHRYTTPSQLRNDSIIVKMPDGRTTKSLAKGVMRVPVGLQHLISFFCHVLDITELPCTLSSSNSDAEEHYNSTRRRASNFRNHRRHAESPTKSASIYPTHGTNFPKCSQKSSYGNSIKPHML